MRVCLLYDCLFPYTVGGAERWYRSLSERLVADGHDVTYVTLRQWDRGEQLDLDQRVRVVSVGPRMELYADGRRRVIPPIVFGFGVFTHLLRRGGDYDVVHTASFPYFSLLAAALLRRFRGYQLVVDWHEVWTKAYWREYLGRFGGTLGYLVQLLCVHAPQRAFCFSQLHAARLRSEGLHGEVTVLEGEYGGSLKTPLAHAVEPVVVFAGRLIREKRPELAVAAFAIAAERIAGLRGEFFGDGPERAALLAAISAHDVSDRVSAPGFVAAGELERALGGAMCMLSTSRREGYGLVVIEAAALAVPSIVVAGEDNAAVELIVDGVNGFVAADDRPDTIARAIVQVHELGFALRESTARWFAENAQRLSLQSSLEAVLASYAAGLRR
ncbi:MAG: glycosyltransferase [Solirubrobacteraceae bacterium]